MRNKILSVMLFLAITLSPAVAIAEPQIKDEEVDENKIVTNIHKLVDPETSLAKEEIAAREIKENLKRINRAKRNAALKARSLAGKPVIKADYRKEFSAVYAAAGKKFHVDPAILAAVHKVESGGRGNTTVASYAGAQGPMQFMPATFRAYAVDGDGDGVANIYDVDDAIFTAAHYLASNGADHRGSVDNALYRYNHSYAYVNHVLAIARGYGYVG